MDRLLLLVFAVGVMGASAATQNASLTDNFDINSGNISSNTKTGFSIHRSCDRGTVATGFMAKWGRDCLSKGLKVFCGNPIDNLEGGAIEVATDGLWQYKERRCLKEGYLTAYRALIRSRNLSKISQVRFRCNYINEKWTPNWLFTPTFLHPGPVSWTKRFQCEQGEGICGVHAFVEGKKQNM